MHYLIPLFADTVTLKSGKTFENIKAKITQEKISFTLNGKDYRFAKAEVKAISIRVVISLKVKNESDRKINEAEKIRVAEALQDTNEFEIDPEKKLQFAILNFKGGEGVSKEELELLQDLMDSNFVKTKLFIMLDRTTVNKKMETSGGQGCSKNLETCTLKINEIGNLIGAPKLLTANVKKINKKYYISGSILDSKKASIDFAETVTAESSEKFEEAISLFSKRVAGGITEYWDQVLIPKLSIQKNYRRELFFSAAVPGLGQWKKNDRKKSIFIGTSFFVGLGILFNSYKNYEDKKNEFQNYDHLSILGINYPGLGYYSYIQSKNLESEISNQTNQIQTVSVLLGLLYFYNLYDAYYTNEKGGTQNAGLNLQIQNKFSNSGGETNYALSYSWNY
jgi:hypothetical protein